MMPKLPEPDGHNYSANLDAFYGYWLLSSVRAIQEEAYKAGMAAAVPDGLSMNSATFGLHVVPQYTYHADAEIVGTADALAALRDAISIAIKHGDSEMKTFASDGEGYTLTVRKLDEGQFSEAHPYYAFMNNLSASPEVK